MSNYTPSAGGLSSTVRDMKISTNLKAKTEELTDRLDNQTKHIKKFETRGNQQIAALRAHDRITSQVDAHDLKNWAKLFDGTENLLKASVKEIAKDGNEELMQGFSLHEQNGTDWARINQNEEVMKPLREGKIQGQKLKDLMIKAGADPDFAENYINMTRTGSHGFHWAAMQTAPSTFDRELPTFLERVQAENKQYQGTKGPFTAHNFDELSDEQQGIILSDLNDEISARFIKQPYNEGVKAKYLYNPLAKKKSEYLNKAAPKRQEILSRKDIDDYVLDTQVAVEAAIVSGDYDEAIQLIQRFHESNTGSFNSLSRLGKLGQKTSGTANVDRQRTMIEDIINSLGKADARIFVTKILKPALTEKFLSRKSATYDADKQKFVPDNAKLPFGDTLNDHPKLNYVEFELKMISKSNQEHAARETNVKTRAKSVGMEYVNKWNDAEVPPSPQERIKIRDQILVANEDIANNPDAVATLNELIIDYEPQLKGNAAISRLRLLHATKGKRWTAADVANIDPKTRDEFMKTYSITLGDVAWGEDVDKEDIIELKKGVFLAAGNNKPLTGGMMGADYKPNTKQIANKQWKEVVRQAQLEQDSIEAKTGFRPGDYETAKKYATAKIEEFTLGSSLTQAADGTRLEHNASGWDQKEQAMQFDPSVIMPDYADEIRHARTELRRFKGNKQALLKTPFLKDYPHLLQNDANDVPKAALVFFANELGVLPRDLIKNQNELINQIPANQEGEEEDVAFFNSNVGLGNLLEIASMNNGRGIDSVTVDRNLNAKLAIPISSNQITKHFPKSTTGVNADEAYTAAVTEGGNSPTMTMIAFANRYWGQGNYDPDTYLHSLRQVHGVIS